MSVTENLNQRPIGKFNFVSWEILGKIVICLIIFLIPLFFLPWTSNYLELNKQVLLSVLVFLASVFISVKYLSSGGLKLKPTIIDTSVITLVIVYGLSAAFSVSRYNSFWGWPSSIADSFTTLILLVLLYFLVVKFFHGKKNAVLFLSYLAASGFLAVLFNILQLFGNFIFPWDITKTITFNTIGTPYSVAIFSAVLLPLIITLILQATKIIRWLLYAAGLIILLGLVMINFAFAWIVLAIEMLLMFFIGMYVFGAKNRLLVVAPVVLLSVAIFFTVLKIDPFSFLELPVEIALSNSTTIEIAKHALLSSSLLGTGPGTFTYNYARFKPLEINNTSFWNVRFESGSSEIFNKIITVGIFGTISLLFIFILVLWFGTRRIKDIITEGGNDSGLLLSGVFTALAGLILAQFLYPINFVLWAMFWLLLALLAVLIGKEEIVSVENPEVGTTIKVFLVLILITMFGFILAGAPKYLAEIKYSSAWKSDDLNSLMTDIGKAIDLNPSVDLYRRELASVSLMRIQEIMANQAISPETALDDIRNLALQSSQSIEKAVALNPKNISNLVFRGTVYQSLIGIIDGVDLAAINAYRSAIELEPLNPSIFTEIGRIYIGISDNSAEESREKETNLKIATENIEKAISLKADYLPAYFLQAVIDVRNGKTADAIKKLEELKIALPDDADLAFQLGVMYYNNGQFEESKPELERSLELNSSLVGSHYFLGLVADKAGDKEEAIRHFEVLTKLNPDNNNFTKILENLRAGKEALDGIGFNGVAL